MSIGSKLLLGLALKVTHFCPILILDLCLSISNCYGYIHKSPPGEGELVQKFHPISYHEKERKTQTMLHCGGLELSQNLANSSTSSNHMVRDLRVCLA